MDLYFLVKTLHILSSTILFGTGLGIAFLNFWGQRQSSLSDRYFAAKLTVLMDFIFTTPAVVFQPISGYALLQMGGYEWSDSWILCSIALYIMAGFCWIPVVYLQVAIRNILKSALESGTSLHDLPTTYHHYLKIWFLLGWPAFLGLLAVFYLMVSKGMTS